MYYVCLPLLRTHSSGVSMFCDLCVCVSCACIDWTVERQVSIVIVSGFFFSRARRIQTLILGFSDWFLYLIFENFVLRVAGFFDP